MQLTPFTIHTLKILLCFAYLKRIFFFISQLAESTTRIRAFEAELDALMQYQVSTHFYPVVNYKSVYTYGPADPY